jgi:ATP-dependent Clp protease ATP-binding subunit ClpA
MFERYSKRALRVMILSRWAAGKRGASFIELEDLLESLIREDQGEFSAAMSAMYPGTPAMVEQDIARRAFFSEDEARKLLNVVEAPSHGTPVLSQDMPIAKPLGTALKAAAKIADRIGGGRIKPLHLLAAIVEERESQLAKLLRKSGITRQRVALALESATKS